MKKNVLAAVVGLVFVSGAALAHGDGNDHNQDRGVSVSASFGGNDSHEVSVSHTSKTNMGGMDSAVVSYTDFGVKDKVTGNGNDYGVNLFEKKTISATLVKNSGDLTYGYGVNYSHSEITALKYKVDGFGLTGQAAYAMGHASLYSNVDVVPAFLATSSPDGMNAQVDFTVGVGFNVSNDVALFSEVKTGALYDTEGRRTDMYSTIGTGVKVSF
jgi:hypothetical protein